MDLLTSLLDGDPKTLGIPAGAGILLSGSNFLFDVHSISDRCGVRSLAKHVPRQELVLTLLLWYTEIYSQEYVSNTSMLYTSLVMVFLLRLQTEKIS